MNGMATAEADRRIANVAQIGKVISVDAETTRATVKIGDLTTPSIPVGQLRAGVMSFMWMPSVGEQVLVIAPSGDMAQAVITASIFAGNAPSASGAKPMLDLGGGTMIINGDVEVTGTLKADVDVEAAGISLKEHTHGDVAFGINDTGEPNS